MLLYIIRHADPIYSPDSLTEKGLKQAVALGRRLALNGIDEIYTSPMLRARQTAEPACKLLGLTPKILDWTSESLTQDSFFVKHLESGRTGWIFHQQVTNIKNNDTISIPIEKTFDIDAFKDYDVAAFKSGYERIANESDKFLSTLGYERDGTVYKITSPNNKKIAVFCHQGFGVTWLSHLLQIPPHIFWTTFNIAHSSVTILSFDNYENKITAPKCLQMSDLSHLYADEGVEFTYDNELKL